VTAVSPVEPAYDDGLLKITWLPHASGFRVEGTVDVTSRGGLAAALSAAQQGARIIHVDLSGVDFIDMEGLRTIARAARDLGEGRLLVLERVPSYVQALLRATNWDTLPGLHIGEVGLHIGEVES
jgi:anti-anti-sigma regulatory factor